MVQVFGALVRDVHLPIHVNNLEQLAAICPNLQKVNVRRTVAEGDVPLSYSTVCKRELSCPLCDEITRVISANLQDATDVCMCYTMEALSQYIYVMYH